MKFFRAIIILSLAVGLFISTSFEASGQPGVSKVATTYAEKMVEQVLIPLKGILNEAGMQEVGTRLGNKLIPFSTAGSLFETEGIGRISANQLNKVLSALGIADPVRWSKSYTKADIAELTTATFEEIIQIMTNPRFLERGQSIDPLLAYLKSFRVLASIPEYEIDAGLTSLPEQAIKVAGSTEYIDPLFNLPDNILAMLFNETPGMPNVLTRGAFRFAEPVAATVPTVGSEAFSYVQASVGAAETILNATNPANFRIRADVVDRITTGLNDMAEAFSIEHEAALPHGKTTLSEPIHIANYGFYNNIVQRTEASYAYAIGNVPAELENALKPYALRATTVLRRYSERSGIPLRIASLVDLHPGAGTEPGLVQAYRTLMAKLEWKRVLRPSPQVIKVFGE
jgi:hypothetical protein